MRVVISRATVVKYLQIKYKNLKKWLRQLKIDYIKQIRVILVSLSFIAVGLEPMVLEKIHVYSAEYL